MSPDDVALVIRTAGHRFADRRRPDPRLSVGTLAALALLLVATLGLPAAAEPPEIERPQSVEGTTIETAAGEGCAFATVIEVIAGKEGGILFEDRAILTALGLTARVSRADDPSTFVDLNVSGTFHVTFEGDVQYLKATGRNLLFNYPGQPDPFMLWTSGRVDLIDDGASLTIVDSRSARIIDVCALLS